MDYRKLNNNEIGLYSELYESVFAEEPWNEEFDTKLVRKYFQMCCESNMYGGFVAKEKEIVCGVITYYLKPGTSGTVIYIDELFVREDSRKKGVGSTLISQVEKVRAKRDAVSIIIHTDENSDAYRLYKFLGFECDGELVSLYKNFRMWINISL